MYFFFLINLLDRLHSTPSSIQITSLSSSFFQQKSSSFKPNSQFRPENGYTPSPQPSSSISQSGFGGLSQIFGSSLTGLIRGGNSAGPASQITNGGNEYGGGTLGNSGTSGGYNGGIVDVINTLKGLGRNGGNGDGEAGFGTSGANNIFKALMGGGIGTEEGAGSRSESTGGDWIKKLGGNFDSSSFTNIISSL